MESTARSLTPHALLGLVALSVAPSAAAQEDAPPPDSEAPAPESAPAEPSPTQPAPPRAGDDEAQPETEEDSVYEEIDVSVLGTKLKETTGSAHALREKDLERFEYDDPHAILRSVPGVYVREEDGFGLRPNIGMRGALSDRSKKVTLMEDGVLFGPAPYSAPAAYYFPIMTRMSSVRVIKGPSAIVYGPHTVAGAIDLVTAPIPDGEHVYADLSMGAYLTRKGHIRASASGERLGILIEGVHLGSDGFKTIDGLPDQNTGFWRNELMLKARALLPTEDVMPQELELKLGFANEQSNETYVGLTDEDFAADPYRRYASSAADRMDWTRTQVVLTHRAQMGDTVNLTSNLYRHDLTRAWNRVQGLRGASVFDVLTNPDTPLNQLYLGVLRGEIPASTDSETILIGPNDRTYVSQGFQTKLDWRPKTGPITHRIEVGARLHYDSIDRLHTQSGFNLVDGELTPDGNPVETTTINEAHTFALALWAADAATWGPVTLSAGVRAESIQSRLADELADQRAGITQQVVLPGGGAFVALPADFGVFAGLYQGFSPIPPGQSENVTPEKSINAEWGVRYSPGRALRVEAIGFFNAYSNLSNVCTFSTGCVADAIDQQFDAGQATIAGLEVFSQADGKVGDVVIPARIAYTFTRATFANSFESADPIFQSVREGDTLPYVPEHQLNASIGAEWKFVGGNIAGTYIDSMREVAGSGPPGEGEATDRAFLLDASLNVMPLSWLTIYGVGRNLLDMSYIAARRPFGARPGAPLMVSAGVKATY